MPFCQSGKDTPAVHERSLFEITDEIQKARISSHQSRPESLIEKDQEDITVNEMPTHGDHSE